MLLILTHENADFDAVASQLAAHKLYPEGLPLLPRRINRNVNQFLTLYWDALPFMRPEEWQRKRVERVLIVDTQALNSVRGLVRRPNVRVIDHHAARDLREDWSYQIERVGATSTLLVEIIQSSGLALTIEEATLLMLGVYEDTGSLTYATTTPRDVRAAAFLLECGAQLGVVRRFLDVALTPVQRELYDRLQESARWLDVGGHSIVLASTQAPESFEEEISSVAHRLRDALSAVALLVLVGLHDDVQLVARSTSSYIDVSVVARALGGGGHERAAAAMVNGRSLRSVEAEVIAKLPEAIKPMASVAQIMSYGVQTVTPGMSVSEAATLMQRFGYEGYPVVDEEDQRLVGLLTRRAVDRAMSHELGHLPIGRIMKTGAVHVWPSDSVERVQQLMLDEGWGQIPVLSEEEGNRDRGRPIGVVTRTDVLNTLFKPTEEIMPPDMRQLLGELLSRALWEMVLAASEVADGLRMPLYFVGGLVRDLLLRQPATDLDMVVEGDAIALVRQLQSQFGGDVRTHARFGTGKWLMTPEVWRALAPGAMLDDVPSSIDFVTARTEFYTEPSALPEVERGSIKLDLHRRDFTINTLAVRLDGPHLGELLDFYGGRRDLEQGIIRVLHSLSFVDDPTRILRAVRLEQRLAFRIESRSSELMAAALPMLDRVTGSRIRHELELALHEAEPERIMNRLAQLGVMGHIYPGLTWSAELSAVFRRATHMMQDPTWGSLLRGESLVFSYFALWMIPMPETVRLEAMERLRVRKATREDVLSVSRVLDALRLLPEDPMPSQVVKALRQCLPRVLAVTRVAVGDGPAGPLIDRYFSEWRFVKCALTGEDLRQAGLKPGPQYGVILEVLLAARLDGEISSEAEERILLRRILAGRSGEPVT